MLYIKQKGDIMDESLGIPNYHPLYLNVNDQQNIWTEFCNISNFLMDFKDAYAQKHNFQSDALEVRFINYGATELVYVLTLPNKKRFTLLVNQPAVSKQYVLQEAKTLQKLNEQNPNIVAPMQTYQNENYALYVTPYIPLARCVATNAGRWGLYIPEPKYYFKPLNEQQRKTLHTCMVAKLISTFDTTTNTGIAACQFDGNDFMVEQGWEIDENPTIASTIPKLHFIAARETIHCSFIDYFTYIVKEFTEIATKYNSQQNKINKQCEVPLQMEEIQNGILLGTTLLKNRYMFSPETKNK